MDVFSHFLLPFGVALVVFGLWRHPPEDPGPGQVNRRQDLIALAVVFGAAGASPDLDSIYHGLRHTGDLYFLQHRGVSHTLLGAPLHGLVSTGLIVLTARIFPKRLGWLHWRAAYIPTAVLGGFSHLLLDAWTYGGVPLWWPITSQAVSLNLYPWLLIWMVPPAGIVTVLWLLGRLSTRRVAIFTIVLVLLVAANGGIRIAERPPILEEEQAYPRSMYQEWIVLTPDQENEDAWFVQIYFDGRPQEPQWHNQTRIEPGSEDALRLAKETNDHRGFTMNTFGPIIIETEPLDDHTWEITFTAIVARLDAKSDPAWTPTRPHEDWGLLRMHVTNETVQTLHRGW